jgi:ABC-type polysaccharide/polyol phosphate export permease
MVARNVVIFAHNLVVVLVLMLYFQTPPTPALAMVIPGFFVVTLLGFFAAQVLAPLCLRFRDISQIIANGVQLAFFVTPIIWPPNQGRVSELIVHANPFFHLIELVRAPLLGNFPTMANWVVSLSLVGGFAIAAVIVGAMSRKRLFLWL